MSNKNKYCNYCNLIFTEEITRCPFCFKPTIKELSIADTKAMVGSASKGNDPVNHPLHYKDHPTGIECITITEHFNFNRGNAIKYIWRAGKKSPEKELQDLEKAAWYIKREIERLRLIFSKQHEKQPNENID